MTTLALLLMLQAPAAPVPAPVPAQELLAVKNVYILPMGNAFDQFLANAITRKGVLQVVTDPAKADVIFTDRLGQGFEMKMHELYPEPKAEEPPKPAKDKEKDKDEEAEAKPGTFDVKNTLAERPSTFGRGKGTYFLVNRSTRNVVWSAYEKPSTSMPEDLNDRANSVAGQLANAIQKQAKGLK